MLPIDLLYKIGMVNFKFAVECFFFKLILHLENLKVKLLIKNVRASFNKV